jgi:phosphatidylglycerophosphate synthase
MSTGVEFEKNVPSPFERGFEKLSEKLVRFVPTGIHPNQITGVAFVMGLVAGLGFYLARFNPWFFWLGSLGVFLHLVGDCLDGAVARARNLCSRSGYYLDQFTDLLAGEAIFLGLAFSGYAHTSIVLLAGILYPTHYVLIQFWINLTKKWPFPRFGPFEFHALLVFLAGLTFFLGDGSWVLVSGYRLSFFDISILILAPFSFMELLISATKLFWELKRLDALSS